MWGCVFVLLIVMRYVKLCGWVQETPHHRLRRYFIYYFWGFKMSADIETKIEKISDIASNLMELLNSVNRVKRGDFRNGKMKEFFNKNPDLESLLKEKIEFLIRNNIRIRFDFVEEFYKHVHQVYYYLLTEVSLDNEALFQNFDSIKKLDYSNSLDVLDHNLDEFFIQTKQHLKNLMSEHSVINSLNNVVFQLGENEKKFNDLDVYVSSEKQKIEAESKRAKALVEDILQKKDNFDQNVATYSNIAQANLYLKIYEAEIRSANRYRMAAISIFTILMCLMSVEIVVYVFDFVIGSFTGSRDYSALWSEVGYGYFLKTLVLVALSAPAWYMTRESELHRKAAYKAKIVEAELTSLPHYLLFVNSEYREFVSMLMTDKFFGQSLYTNERQDKAEDFKDKVQATTEAMKFVTEILKKKQ
jgi:hypothetical protein